jgi:hypothetical protein
MDISSLITIVIGLLGSLVVLYVGIPFGVAILVIAMIWLTILFLFFWGAIGPPTWRAKMQRLQTYLQYDSTLFFPYDATKSPAENRQAMGTRPPFKERLTNMGRNMKWYSIVLIVCILILFAFIIVIAR